MSEQFKTALIRSVIGGAVAFGLTFFTTLQAADATPTRAAISAAVAFFSYVMTRGLGEGGIDTGRNNRGDVRPADVSLK